MNEIRPTPTAASSNKVLYATLLFPPAGIFLGWRNGEWSRNAKIGWTIVGLVIFVAWGGVVGFVRGSDKVSFFEVLNGVAVAAAAYAIFKIWTHISWSAINKALLSAAAVLSLAVLGGVDASRQKGPRDLKHGMTPEDVVAIMGQPDSTVQGLGFRLLRWNLGHDGEYGFDPDNCVHAGFNSGFVSIGEFDEEYRLDTVEVTEKGRKAWSLPSQRAKKK